jgi:hypothetical protein
MLIRCKLGDFRRRIMEPVGDARNESRSTLRVRPHGFAQPHVHWGTLIGYERTMHVGRILAADLRCSNPGSSH